MQVTIDYAEPGSDCTIYRVGDAVYRVRAGYYLASCDHCGWIGSSEFCGVDWGGDDSDVYCPTCHRPGADCGSLAEDAHRADLTKTL